MDMNGFSNSKNNLVQVQNFHRHNICPSEIVIKPFMKHIG